MIQKTKINVNKRLNVLFLSFGLLVCCCNKPPLSLSLFPPSVCQIHTMQIYSFKTVNNPAPVMNLLPPLLCNLILFLHILLLAVSLAFITPPL